MVAETMHAELSQLLERQLASSASSPSVLPAPKENAEQTEMLPRADGAHGRGGGGPHRMILSNAQKTLVAPTIIRIISSISIISSSTTTSSSKMRDGAKKP